MQRHCCRWNLFLVSSKYKTWIEFKLVLCCACDWWTVVFPWMWLGEWFADFSLRYVSAFACRILLYYDNPGPKHGRSVEWPKEIYAHYWINCGSDWLQTPGLFVQCYRFTFPHSAGFSNQPSWRRKPLYHFSNYTSRAFLEKDFFYWVSRIFREPSMEVGYSLQELCDKSYL